MQSQLETDRISTRTNMITTDRPDSSQLVDLHIYIIPKSVWKDRQNLVENEAMEQAVSAGFVRVSQNLTIQELRQHILNICGQEDDFPKEFIYLRSVGRCLARVKPQQEADLRVKNYRPPITFAPEIYLLEGNHEEMSSATPNSKSFLFRESPIQQGFMTPPQLPMNRQQSWTKPLSELNQPAMLTNYPSLMYTGERQNSINLIGLGSNSFSNLSTASSTLSARDLAKLREEQERLRLRQIELARQRREIELEQQRRAKELLDKQKNTSKMQQEREEAAATCIQAAYRGHRDRRQLEEERQRKIAANEIERLKKEARELTRRKAEQEHTEEIEAHDVSKLSDHLEALKAKRLELEASRETIVRRMQQLHAQISVRRKEERDIWKQKYLLEKKKTTELEDTIKETTKDEPDLSFQIEQAKIRLNNAAKLRLQAETECRTLKQELHQIRLNMNNLEKPSLTKQPSSLQLQTQQQQQQPNIPINLDITLQY